MFDMFLPYNELEYNCEQKLKLYRNRDTDFRAKTNF
jgi:hypothetical protein